MELWFCLVRKDFDGSKVKIDLNPIGLLSVNEPEVQFKCNSIENTFSLESATSSANEISEAGWRSWANAGDEVRWETGAETLANGANEESEATAGCAVTNDVRPDCDCGICFGSNDYDEPPAICMVKETKLKLVQS